MIVVRGIRHEFGTGDIDGFSGLAIWRPILFWRVEDVFASVKPNPLYSLGMTRVGCAPCIHARKSEILNLSKRFPREVARIREWEALVKLASRRGASTFFAADKIPGGKWDEAHIDAVIEWSMTSRGGRQIDLVALGEAPKCSSVYGLCE